MTLFSLYKFIKDDERIKHPQLPLLRLCPTIAGLDKEGAARLHTMQVNRDMFIKAALK